MFLGVGLRPSASTDVPRLRRRPSTGGGRPRCRRVIAGAVLPRGVSPGGGVPALARCSAARRGIRLTTSPALALLELPEPPAVLAVPVRPPDARPQQLE